ncbi:hypothetical protein DMZ43_07080 [Meridianimaribacter sp. CL38]|uniref:hypothetical protein n=1 Tax=Meridianimaribacter sp. CL38 TaxID=2213021 RepID=UPI00103C0097|nr:hypothetical protein [Meridianimaribacter sp. CL38]TBV26822.1 hypothetical protein DMZ43_07080 [Meridianimaribacter sp. CL38]
MGRGNKKKKVISQKNDEYDLKQSLSKLNQRKELPNSQTSTDFEISKSQTSGINQKILNENLNSETATIYFKLNESFNSRYDTLNDSIQTVRDKISDSSDTLRQELEGKIDSKLETKFFIWTVVALVAIATLIFTLSYSNLISETKENSNSVKSLQKDMENQKGEIKDLEKDIERIEEKQKDLEIEMIKSNK